ncbi:MAG: hypothetical protein PHP69_04290 [Candidatus Omnitrophica bacterium]|nr:hypothetical protein [Candidatus Omnitrophota bacterium]
MLIYLDKKNAGIGFKFLIGILILLLCLTMFIWDICHKSFDNHSGEKYSDELPGPGEKIPLSSKYYPIMIRGVKVDRDNPFILDFYIDSGQEDFPEEIKEEKVNKLVKYFLSALTVPEADLWVNLSPYEIMRITPENFGKTEMGKNLLAQDYVLKQVIASITDPDSSLGSEFWARVYEKAYKLYGTTKVPINTFNKVWIVPDKAVVYEDGMTGYIVESRLRIMTEQDYLALNNNMNDPRLGTDKVSQETAEGINDISVEILREVIIPEMEREINEGENFAQLRQAYNALVLAVWFKRKLKEHFINEVYSDRNKIKGIEVSDQNVKARIYNAYVEAYQKGIYDYVKTDYDCYEHQRISRRYYSGGCDFTDIFKNIQIISAVPNNIISQFDIFSPFAGDVIKSRIELRGADGSGFAQSSPVGTRQDDDYAFKIDKLSLKNMLSRNMIILSFLNGESIVRVSERDSITLKTKVKEYKASDLADHFLEMDDMELGDIRITSVLPSGRFDGDYSYVKAKIKNDFLNDITDDAEVVNVTVEFMSGIQAKFCGNKEMIIRLAEETDVKNIVLGEGTDWFPSILKVIQERRTGEYDAYAEMYEQALGNKVEYKGSDLQGMEVYHGTLRAFARSVLSGPKNVGKGFGGRGLYLAVQGEEELADFFAGWARSEYEGRVSAENELVDSSVKNSAKKILLKGRLNPDRDYKVGRFTITREGRMDLANGVLPADWEKSELLRAVLENEFDILDLRDMRDNGFAIDTNRILVVHERAGKDAVTWENSELGLEGDMGYSSSAVSVSINAMADMIKETHGQGELVLSEFRISSEGVTDTVAFLEAVIEYIQKNAPPLILSNEKVTSYARLAILASETSESKEFIHSHADDLSVRLFGLMMQSMSGQETAEFENSDNKKIILYFSRGDIEINQTDLYEAAQQDKLDWHVDIFLDSDLNGRRGVVAKDIALSVANLFEDSSDDEIVDIIKRCTGDAEISKELFTGEAEVGYIGEGNNKYVFSLSFTSVDGAKHEIVVTVKAKKMGIRPAIDSEMEILLKNQGRNGLPRVGGKFRTAGGLDAYFMEYVPGRSLGDIEDDDGAPYGVRVKHAGMAARAIINTYVALNHEAPTDIHRYNFVEREGTDEAVLIDFDWTIPQTFSEIFLRGCYYFYRDTGSDFLPLDSFIEVLRDIYGDAHTEKLLRDVIKDIEEFPLSGEEKKAKEVYELWNDPDKSNPNYDMYSHSRHVFYIFSREQLGVLKEKLAEALSEFNDEQNTFVDKGKEFGAQVSEVDGRRMNNLRRILNVLRQSEKIPNIVDGLSDSEIIEFVVEYLQILDEKIPDKSLEDPIVTEYTDEYGNRVIKINDLFIETHAEARRIVDALLRSAVDPEDGVKAINFQDGIGEWTIVGFKMELDNENILEHEQREIKLRKEGLNWRTAHRLVESGQDRNQELIKKLLNEQDGEADEYEFGAVNGSRGNVQSGIFGGSQNLPGASSSLSDEDLFNFDVLRVWDIWNNAGEDSFLKEIFSLREDGYIISVGDWTAIVDAVERYVLPEVNGKTQSRVVNAIGLLGENVDMHAGGEGVLMAKIDYETARFYAVVMDKSKGFELDDDGLPEIKIKDDGKFLQRSDSPGKGRGLSVVLNNVDKLNIYTKGYIFDVKNKSLRRHDVPSLLQGALFFLVIDYGNSVFEDRASSSASAAGDNADDLSSPNMATTPGGIDFNPVNLELEVKGGSIEMDGSNVLFDVNAFEGFSFRIIDIKTINDNGAIPTVLRELDAASGK